MRGQTHHDSASEPDRAIPDTQGKPAEKPAPENRPFPLDDFMAALESDPAYQEAIERRKAQEAARSPRPSLTRKDKVIFGAIALALAAAVAWLGPGVIILVAIIGIPAACLVFIVIRAIQLR